ncbi:MAG: ribonuclease HII [Candidatus Aenigmarchaeota archaeon]|nr:ribonuclease HII [Candidatus Aenigmarchaeota archaeon]
MTKILGIDESGRGPVCGPMMICGYLIDEEKIGKLKEWGVKDSKLLTPAKRKEIFTKIKKISDDYVLLKVSAKEIDRAVGETNLNKLEIKKMQHIINLFDADRVIIDSPEVNTKKFAEKVRAGIRNKKTELVCENYADKKHLPVGAASIIAKVNRDMEIEKLHEKYGFFGSGYTSDERTVRFLKDWIKMNKELPDFVRKSWMTIATLKEEKEQRQIMDFAKGE